MRNSVEQVAKDLLGKVLCTRMNGQVTSGKIVETEAYSYKERACHAFGQKRTSRTEVLFMPGGISYVYLCYGIHKLFNVVTNKEGYAEAVLIRAIEPLDGLALMSERRGHKKLYELTSGPGKLSEALGIGMTHNERSLQQEAVWIEDRGFSVKKLTATPRIGVGYAQEDALLPWRYFQEGNPFVSKG